MVIKEEMRKMKRLIGAILVTVLLVTLATPVFAAPKGIDVNGFHYTLNIQGKKADWSGNGDYDHGGTMFVPANSSELNFTGPDGVTVIDGIKTNVGLGSEYSITDGNAFDDGETAFVLPKDRYKVFICMRGKPGFAANIKGWIYDSDSDISLMEIGEFNVGRKWGDATTELLYVDLSGIFGAGYENIYALDLLDGTILDPDGNPLVIDEYFWSLVSNGAKLIKVRIYPV
jgi:hypothetical protein